LPPWLLARKKQPFTVPIEAWLAGSLHDFCHDTLGGCNAFVRDFAAPEKVLEDFSTGPGGGQKAMQLWSLLHLEIWYQNFGRKMEVAA
jgi:hypothetical protein